MAPVKKEKKVVSSTKKEKKVMEPVTRDYTINLHKRVHDIAFKKRAPRAVKEIRKFAQAVRFRRAVEQ